MPDVTRLSTVLLVLSAMLLAPSAAAQVRAGVPPEVRAGRLTGEIVLDGRLDEPAWAAAEPVTGFRQYEPEEGAPASQPTEVRVLYGENSLYVGARLYDENPDAIEATLGRRDDYNRADWFLVAIDSYLDRKTAYVFAVNAAGVQGDGLRAGGGGGPPGVEGVDESWDAIWYSDVRVGEDGWTAELRIPYSMLRFSEAPVQTWGVHFTRRIPRLGEVSEWPLVPRAERTNLVAGYGTLTGMEGVAPRRNLQVQPYAVTGVHTFEDDGVPGELAMDNSVDVGGDLRVSLGPNVSLDATINPDFGQVESDPAVLNLTAFETFFEERRPFFVEGGQIYAFSVGPGQLLYTRRIGADAPIIGAAKVSGRTASGLSFGVLGAVTGDRFDPGRSYGVVRASQQIGAFSSLGAIATGFDARPVGALAGRQAVSGGADWDLRFAGNRYGVEGFAAVTHRETGAGRTETGLAGKTWLRRRQGAWTGFVGLDVFSDTFDPNDVGQLRETNFVALLVNATHDVLGGAPFGPFQRAQVETFTIQRVAYDSGLDLGLSVDLGSQWTLRGFQQVDVGLELVRPFGGYDLYETRGLGPWARPAEVGVGGSFETDDRRAWSVEPGVAVAFAEDGGRGLEAEVGAEWSVSPRLALSAEVEGAWEDGVTAWTANETFLRAGGGWMVGREAGRLVDGGPDAFAPIGASTVLDDLLLGRPLAGTDRYHVPVFGVRDTRSLDATFRSTVTFRPNLSVQLYAQLFLARGRYADFSLLGDRETLTPFAGYPKRDEFAFGSLQSNLVMRWEYRPGSVLYVVWTHGRSEEDVLNPLAPWGPSPSTTPFGEQVGDTFRVFPDNAFLVKLSYTFLR